MSEIENESLLKKQACPMSASVHWNPKEDTKEDARNWLDVYNKLPYQIKLGLVAETTENKIIEIAKKFDFYRVEEVGEISRIIRDSFIEGGFNENNLKKRIIEKIKLDENGAEKLTVELFELRKKVSEIERGGEDIKTEKMPLIPALKKFPEVGNQLIGENKIKISGEEEFKKQSIENWLNDYTLQQGSQTHNNLERSEYVFNSKNVSKLTFLEKKNLLLILESYDQDSDLEIDVDRNLVSFNTTEGEISEKLRESIKKEERENINKKEDFFIESVHKSEEENENIDENIEKEESKEAEIIENGDRIQSKHTINLKDI